MPTGNFFHPRRKIFGFVVDSVRCTVGQRQLAFGVAAGGGNQLQTQRFCPLAGNQAHTAGGGVEQHKVAGHQAFNRAGFEQQILRRQTLEHHRGTRLKADAVG